MSCFESGPVCKTPVCRILQTGPRWSSLLILFLQTGSINSTNWTSFTQDTESYTSKDIKDVKTNVEHIRCLHARTHRCKDSTGQFAEKQFAEN